MKKSENRPLSSKLKSMKVDKYLKQISKEYMTRSKKWHDRAFMAGAINVSLLKEFNDGHVKFLVKLLKFQKEPLVVERAITGIAWSLIKSFGTSSFNEVLELLSKYHSNEKISIYLFEALDYFLSGKKALKLSKAETEQYKQLNLNAVQALEPMHSKISFYEIKSKVFKTVKNSDDFFILLNGSLSLSHSEKLRVTLSLNRLRHQQIADLFRIFKEEIDRFSELAKEVNDKVTELSYRRGSEGFMYQLNNHYQKEIKSLSKKIRTLDKSLFCFAIFKKLPYEGYVKYFKAKDMLNIKNDIEIDFKTIGDYYFNKNNYREAVNSYANIQSSDSNFNSIFRLAFSYSKIGELKSAIEVYRNALKIKQDDKLTYYNIGLIYMKIGETEKGISNLKKAIKIDPNYENAWSALFNTYLKSENYQKSIWAINKVIEINDKEAIYYHSKVYCYDMMEKYSMAINECNKLLKLKLGVPEKIWFRISGLYDKSGDINKSIESLNHALEINPDYHGAKESLGWKYFKKEEYSKARKVFIAVLEVSLRKHALMNLGHCELILYSKKRAIEYYKKSLDLWDCSEVFFNGFDGDYQYMKGVSRKEYDVIKKSLRRYCKRRNS